MAKRVEGARAPYVSPAITERFAYGEVVPTPMEPLAAWKSEEVAERMLVPEKYAVCPAVPVYREEVAMAKVGLEPPTSAPKVPPWVKPRPYETEEVATLATFEGVPAEV